MKVESKLNSAKMLNFDSSRLSHAYIGAESTAEAIAAAVVCSECSDIGSCTSCAHCVKAARGIHPDIIFLSKLPSKREITVDQIRDLKKDVIVLPNEASRKAYIINDAHLMNINAQNAFLQILEEPPKHVVFILKTDFPTQLLPTISSRSILIKLESNIEFENISSSTSDDFEPSKMVADFFDALRKGNVAVAELMFALGKLNKEQFSEFIFLSRHEAASLLKSSTSKNELAFRKSIISADQLLVKANEVLDLNVNVGHISGFICANLIKLT